MILYAESKEGDLMEIKEVLKLNIKQINHVPLTNVVENVYIGDLLSFVMANGKEGSLWLTVQKHINVIAVAQLNDFAGIIFVQNSYPDEDTIIKATELEIPLFISENDAFLVAKDLISLGL
ncbi:hypothetical protein [Thomasclavelia saccharogumia]|uniref:hypothetical protein n=1 Tax=Thomasclavelia saccharogumia TaxID=341225 RepID=UPI000AD383CD|nr:hypothetical protein [Thomasclavelia saccharogumia]